MVRYLRFLFLFFLSSCFLLPTYVSTAMLRLLVLLIYCGSVECANIYV